VDWLVAVLFRCAHVERGMILSSQVPHVDTVGTRVDDRGNVHRRQFVWSVIVLFVCAYVGCIPRVGNCFRAVVAQLVAEIVVWGCALFVPGSSGDCGSTGLVVAEREPCSSHPNTQENESLLNYFVEVSSISATALLNVTWFDCLSLVS